MAQQYSEDVYSVMGGNVGWRHKGTMEKEFDSVAFSLPIGQFTEPMRTAFGYNILKVEEREPARLLRYEEVRERLRSDLQARRRGELRQAWEASLRKNAKIEIVDNKEAQQSEKGAQRERVQLQPSH